MDDTKTRKFCFACDLKNDPKLIEAYKLYHANVWPDITASIKNAGIVDLEIYNAGARLFMIMHVSPEFTFARKDAMDADNPKVQEWEKLMWKYQQAIPIAKPGEKWVLMEQIYKL